MQSTLVKVTGKGSNPKTTLYVGGLEDNVNDAILHAAFLPFGDIKDVSIPMDHASGKHRGFGFVEFEDKEDANAAIDNMNNAGGWGGAWGGGGATLGGGECLLARLLTPAPRSPHHSPPTPTHTELYGRVLRVNFAQPMKIKGGDKGTRVRLGYRARCALAARHGLTCPPSPRPSSLPAGWASQAVWADMDDWCARRAGRAGCTQPPPLTPPSLAPALPPHTGMRSRWQSKSCTSLRRRIG